MRFHNSTAELFIPDGKTEADALSRVTHLGIGAHQDDLEFMAFHGILAGYQNDAEWFAGVTCTNGAGSARTGPYAKFTDEQMRAIRRKEQNVAAQIGQYAAMIQLDYPSAAVKDPHGTALRDDLAGVLRATRPRVVYTHNPADKHETHIGVCVAAIQAIRTLPEEERPETLYGCEVWRDLDWLPDGGKVIQDVSSHENLAAALNGVFDSQIAGGKRYDMGVMGRRRANATFLESHAVDRADSIAFAMDLTPLARDASLDIADFVDTLLGCFRDDVMTKLQQRLGR
jgi:LmbE family N-acetylglucosaminyl deacetylase